MSSLFSHAPSTEGHAGDHGGGAPLPARPLGSWRLDKTVVDAVAGLVEHTHLWWDPDLTFDEGSSVYVAGSRLIEESLDGETFELGTLEAAHTDSDVPTVTLLVTLRDPEGGGGARLGLTLSVPVRDEMQGEAQPDVVGQGEETTEATVLRAFATGQGPHPQVEGDVLDEDWQALVHRYVQFMSGKEL